MNYRCLYDKLVDPKKLKPHPKNRNSHPPDQIDRLAKIIEYQGWRYPVKVSNQSGFVTAGHGRIEVAKALKCKVPVNYQDYESDEQEYADVQSDNAIAAWSELDFSGINADIADLGPEFDIELLGIKNFEIDVADKEPGCDEDNVPDVKEPISKPGDLYILGRHRLLCGDSTDILQVKKLMDGQKADMVFTDPPYGVGFRYNKHDDDGGSKYAEFISELWSVLRTLQCPIVLTPGNVNLPLWFKLDDFSMACWVKKNAMSPSAIAHLNVFEILLLWGVKNRRATDLLEYSVKQQADVGDHPCPKLMAIVDDAIDSWGQGTKVIFEPFAGSGTTIMSCEKSGRTCYAIEMDPHYIDVIVSRYCKYTKTNKVIRNGQEIKWGFE